MQIFKFVQKCTYLRTKNHTSIYYLVINESPYRNMQPTQLDSVGLKLATKPPATERECNLLKYNCFVHFCGKFRYLTTQTPQLKPKWFL